MHLRVNSEILSFKQVASKGWDWNTNSHILSINRGWGIMKMYTKTTIVFVYTNFSLFSKFLLPKQVSTKFSKKELFKPNQLCKHITYIICELSKPSHTTCNHKITKFICHFEAWCSCYTRRGFRALQFIPSTSTHSIRSSEAIQIITTLLDCL